ncbi:unnamed protein product, partial [Schistosoma turkestanicum]
MCDTVVGDRSSITEISADDPTIPSSLTSRYTLNKIKKADRLLVVSSYTIKVLILTIIQTVILSVIVIISST